MANKRSRGQLKLLRLIRDKRNLPTENEIFDIYVGFVCKQLCAMVGTGGKPWYFEQSSDALKQQSFTWYKSALGGLIVRGELNLVL